MELPEDVLSHLKWIAHFQQIIMLLNYYDGVPISHEAAVRSLDPPTVTLDVHPYQAVCLALDGHTVIQSEPLALAVRTRVVSVDVVARTASLTEFNPTTYTIRRRQSVRIESNQPVDVELFVENRSLTGQLENISPLGLSVSLPASQIFFDPWIVFQKDAAVRARLQLPQAASPIELTGTISHGLLRENHYVLGVRLSVKADTQPVIQGYLMQRQAQAVQALSVLYEQMRQTQLAKRPPS